MARTLTALLVYSIVFNLCPAAYSRAQEPGHNCPVNLAPDSLPRPISYTLNEGKARLAIKTRINRNSDAYQVEQLQKAVMAKDTLINELRWERDWYKRSVEQDAIISAQQQKTIARQRNELWIYRSGLVATLLKLLGP